MSFMETLIALTYLLTYLLFCCLFSLGAVTCRCRRKPAGRLGVVRSAVRRPVTSGPRRSLPARLDYGPRPPRSLLLRRARTCRPSSSYPPSSASSSSTSSTTTHAVGLLCGATLSELAANRRRWTGLYRPVRRAVFNGGELGYGFEPSEVMTKKC